MLNRPLSEFYDDNIQRCREEMAITRSSIQVYICNPRNVICSYIAVFLAIIFFYIYIVNLDLTNVCRICGSHSDEDDKFWVSFIGRLVLLCI